MKLNKVIYNFRTLNDAELSSVMMNIDEVLAPDLSESLLDLLTRGRGKFNCVTVVINTTMENTINKGLE